MAIVGPWVGSAAKAETGEAWMAAAMEKLKISRPALMSSMIGKSQGASITTANWAVSTISNWGATRSPSDWGNRGVISNPEAIAEGSSLVAIVYSNFNPAPAYPIAIQIAGGPTRAITLTLDGVNQVAQYNASLSNANYRYYQVPRASMVAAFRDLLMGTGVSRTLTMV